MRKSSTLLYLCLGFGAMGCAATAPTSHEESEIDVAEAVAALSAEDSDATLEAATEADREGWRRHDRADRTHRPRGRGHGIGLLLWYADLDAVEQCRELRATCESDAADSCGAQVKDCLRPVLEQAFAALCEERLAECEDGSDKRSCDRITAHCERGIPDRGGHGHDDDGGVDEASDTDETSDEAKN